MSNQINLIKGFVNANEKTMVGVIDPTKLKSFEFNRESDLSCYIETNIESFCADVLDDIYVRHEKEVQAESQMRFQPRQPRVDFVIECEKKTHIVELKNPKNVSENRNALGQILSYSTMLDPLGECALVVVTTKHDMLTARAIKRFNLPVRYVYFEKGRFMEYIHD